MQPQYRIGVNHSLTSIVALVSISLLHLCSSALQGASVLTNVIQLPSTTKSCPACGDGNFDTAGGSSYSDNGPSQTSYAAEFTFQGPVLITQVDFRISVYGYEYGDDTGYVILSYRIEWFDGIWHDLPNSQYSENASQYHDALQRSHDSGHVILTNLSLANCTGIRAYAYARSYNIKNSNENGNVQIYEVQAMTAMTVPPPQGEPQCQCFPLAGETLLTTPEIIGATYQWSKDGDDITGATNRTFLLTNLQFSDSATYRSVVSTIFGTTTNSAVKASVVARPAISVERLGTGFVKLSISGAPDNRYEIEGSDNLNAWSFVAIVGGGSQLFEPTIPFHRFYRLKVVCVCRE